MQLSTLITFTCVLLSSALTIPTPKPALSLRLQARSLEYWDTDPDPWYNTHQKRQTGSQDGGALDPNCVQNEKGIFCTYSAEQVASYEDQKGDDAKLGEGCVELDDGGVVCEYPGVGV